MVVKKSETSNLIETTLEELIQLEYKPAKFTIDSKGKVSPPKPGSMLCLTNKSKDLWVELTESDIKASKVTADKFLILTK